MELWQTAIHEAAHAVVGHVLDLTHCDLALTHHEVHKTGIYGYVTGPNARYGYGYGSPRDLQATLRAAAIASCAGLAAENEFFGVPIALDNKNAQGDFQGIIQLERDGLKIRGKRNGFVGDEQTWRYIELRLVEARKLVKSHRLAVETIAKKLMRSQKLSKIQFEKAMRILIPD